MCDPVTLGSAALMGASTLANSAASGQQARARDKALGAERQRQGELQRQAEGVQEKSRGRYDDFAGKEDARAGKLGAYFNKGLGEEPTAVGAGSGAPSDALPASGSNLVVQEQAKQGGKARAYGQQQGAALGELRSFGDLLGETSRGQARDAGEIGQINNFRQGSAAVTPYELEAANAKGSGLKLFGDLLGGAGQIGMTAGLTKNVAGVGGAAPAAGGASLPSFAQPQATAPMSLGSMMFGAIPSFASGNNAYKVV
ncbi:hypothetical protein ASF22_02725 [Methylobacterium sp. Leaf87]|uniref:hypothetical protein n=1 Tax=Methylobacterium sp. Leaf87 TaxID=1736243 RepID=UPI0006FE989F|nr:hypothetical protein [Methylobacterium sp. Leaf87]KQO69541.1 hypothetical protein ASF22_02725 [Methylobacterium sp. Leaf87]